MNCPLCNRELGTVNISEHHLIPKSKKGKEKFPIHNICHRKIHSVFSEKELAQTYNTWDALKNHEEIQKFIVWVKKKDPAYYDGSSNVKKRK